MRDRGKEVESWHDGTMHDAAPLFCSFKISRETQSSNSGGGHDWVARSLSNSCPRFACIEKTPLAPGLTNSSKWTPWSQLRSCSRSGWSVKVMFVHNLIVLCTRSGTKYCSSQSGARRKELGFAVVIMAVMSSRRREVSALLTKGAYFAVSTYSIVQEVSSSTRDLDGRGNTLRGLDTSAETPIIVMCQG